MLSTEGIWDSMLTEKASKRSMVSEGWTLQEAIIFPLPQMYKVRRNAISHSCSFLLQYFLLKGATLSMLSSQSYQLREFEQVSAAGSEDDCPNSSLVKCPRASLTLWAMRASYRKGNFPATSFGLQKEISLFSRNTNSRWTDALPKASITTTVMMAPWHLTFLMLEIFLCLIM